MNKEQIASISGGEYLDLFTKGYKLSYSSPEEIKAIAGSVKRHLQRLCGDNVQNNKGHYTFMGEASSFLRQLSGSVFTLASNGEIIRLPDTKLEREKLGMVLTESLLLHRGRLRFIAPVCPDYGKDDLFYKKMGRGISPEAEAAINAALLIANSFPEYKYQTTIEIAVADTEDDKPEILHNCAAGSVELYEANCRASVAAIAQKTERFPNIVVATFKDMFGTEFRQKQYFYEEVIRQLIEEEDNLKTEMINVSDQRLGRHAQILGRGERDLELTIRYSAQYAALGTIVRNYPEPTIVLNYQTPNRLFFNAAFYKNKQIALSNLDQQKVVPVLGTIARRR